jgi:hypothetical protein
MQGKIITASKGQGKVRAQGGRRSWAWQQRGAVRANQGTRQKQSKVQGNARGKARLGKARLH